MRVENTGVEVGLILCTIRYIREWGIGRMCVYFDSRGLGGGI